MKKKILFIINPCSGTTSKRVIPEFITQNINHDLFDIDIHMTQGPGDATTMAHAASERSVDAVVAVGGDGTVNEVARGLVHTHTALGIIPCGSGNGLARHLLIPRDIKKSLGIINDFVVHDLDYCVINDMPFFCTCGMGFDAFVSQKFAEAGKRGPVTYVQKVLEEGLKYKPETYILKDDTGTQSYKAFLITCANASQYGNNAYIAPQASMSDGLMDVVIMEPFNVLEAPQIAIDMFSKTLDKSSRIKTFRTKHLTIHRQEPGVIHFDGDPAMTGKDIDVHVEEKGIRIIVNPNGDKRLRRPNLLQTSAADLFNDLSGLHDDLVKQTRRGIALTKLLQKKFGKTINNIK